MTAATLKANLEAGGLKDLVLQICHLYADTVWPEFGDFFTARQAKTLNLEVDLKMSEVYDYKDARSWSNYERRLLPLTFLSCTGSYKAAVSKLRAELKLIKDNPSVKVHAFLALPSTVALAPKGLQTQHAAFCFLFLTITVGGCERPVTVDDLKQMGLSIAVQEGSVGSPVEEPVTLIEDSPMEEGGFVSDDEREADANCITEASQDELYPMQPYPVTKENIVETNFVQVLGEDGKPPSALKTELTLTNIHDPVEAVTYMHPEIAAAARKHGISLNQSPGRELEEMRKYFGQGSGMYLVTVDFQLARTQAFKLDDRAQKKITKALKAKPKKRSKVKTGSKRTSTARPPGKKRRTSKR